MKVELLFSTLLACGSFVGSVQVVAQNACEPIRNLSCDAWPQQVQVMGTVTDVQPFVDANQQLCKVTFKPSSWQMHALCPMLRTSVTVAYDVCGACPKVGSMTSGVLMSNENGLIVLDR